MIDFTELLATSRIQCHVDIKSKKKALQTLAELIGQDLDIEELSEMDFLDALIGREKLGSTGLGHGVSLPHGRIKGLEQPLASLITLTEGVDYESPDNEPVDILFGLVVPEHCNDEHLTILASLARAFNSAPMRHAVRQCTAPDELLKTLKEHTPAVPPAASAE